MQVKTAELRLNYDHYAIATVVFILLAKQLDLEAGFWDQSIEALNKRTVAAINCSKDFMPTIEQMVSVIKVTNFPDPKIRFELLLRAVERNILPVEAFIYIGTPQCLFSEEDFCGLESISESDKQNLN